MFTKVVLAVAVILGTASASFAAPKKSYTYSEPQYFKQATGAEWWRA